MELIFLVNLDYLFYFFVLVLVEVVFGDVCVLELLLIDVFSLIWFLNFAGVIFIVWLKSFWEVLVLFCFFNIIVLVKIGWKFLELSLIVLL